jgi:alkylation response protein AidB-like acyl-CoA dehydrogenase
MLASSALLEGVFGALLAVMVQETSTGVRPIDSPVLRDRLTRLQARLLSMKYHSLRMLTCNLKGESTGVAGLVTKLTGCELSHQIAALAIVALGELGVLYDGSKYLRNMGMWQFQYMFSLGLIIGGGTAQIQKNIISERGLGMPREPRLEKGRN